MGAVQDHMLDMNKIEKLYDKEFERRITLTDLRFEEKRARECAAEGFQAFSEIVGGGLTCAILIAASQYTKNRLFAIPVPSLAMWVGYRIDQNLGTNFEAIKKEADELLKSDDKKTKLFKLVGPSITLKELDKRIELRNTLNRTL